LLQDIADKKNVEIVEVGPRDGLQNEKNVLALQDKVKLIDSLIKAGIKQIEATSFVHPKWVPQLADASELMENIRNIKGRDGVRVSVLIPNQKGFSRAMDVGVEEICLFVSASESHNQENVNMTPEDSINNFKDIIKTARSNNIRVRNIIVCAFACPFEGKVDPEAVLELANKLQELGTNEVILADTIGHANPKQVFDLFNMMQKNIEGINLSAHFHDTMGMGLANVVAALEAGIYKFDASIGGLGGCPYAPGASGNIATEELVNMLHTMGFETGIDLDRILEAVDMLEGFIGRSVQTHLKTFRATCSR